MLKKPLFYTSIYCQIVTTPSQHTNYIVFFFSTTHMSKMVNDKEEPYSILVSESNIPNKCTKERTMTTYMSLYIYTGIISKRANEVETKMSEPMVKWTGEWDAMGIAQLEFKEKKLQYIVRRYWPDDESFEDFHVNEMYR